jgi:hypothetical protein
MVMLFTFLLLFGYNTLIMPSQSIERFRGSESIGDNSNLSKGSLGWNAVPDAVKYKVYVNVPGGDISKAQGVFQIDSNNFIFRRNIYSSFLEYKSLTTSIFPNSLGSILAYVTFNEYAFSAGAPLSDSDVGNISTGTRISFTVQAFDIDDNPLTIPTTYTFN